MLSIQRWRTNVWLPLAIACLSASMVLFATLIDVGTPLIVLSGSSMVPTLKPGDLVLLNKPHITEIQVNDMIAFRVADQSIVVHRVVEKSTDSIGQTYLVTKGDSNQWNDKEQTDEHNYVGKVSYVVPKVGAFIDALQNPLVLILAAITIAAYVLYQRRGTSGSYVLTRG